MWVCVILFGSSNRIINFFIAELTLLPIEILLYNADIHTRTELRSQFEAFNYKYICNINHVYGIHLASN